MRVGVGSRRFLGGLGLWICLPPLSEAHGQDLNQTRRAYVVERTTHDRWLQGQQRPEFVSFREARDPIRLVATSIARSGALYWEGRIGQLKASFAARPQGATRLVSIDRPSLHISEFGGPDERRANRRRYARGSRRGPVGLPAAQFWDLYLRVPAGELAPGLEWTDTLSFVADPGEGLSEELDGVWTRTIIADTTIGGRAYPLIQSRAEVELRAVDILEDHAIRGDLSIEYVLSGTIEGHFALDPELGLRAVGADTASWSGIATLVLSDGRRFAEPARYDRIRTWSLHDSVSYASVEDSIRAERRRSGSGMLVFPDETEKRLRDGDQSLRDSLLAVWRDSRDPDELGVVGRALRRWSGSVPQEASSMESLLRTIQSERGDTAGAIAATLESRDLRLTEEWLPRLLPYLDDVGRLWHLGITPRWTYGEFLTEVYMSTPILEPDSTRWGCEPAACRQLRAMLGAAREERLRDVALVASFVRDPTGLYEQLRARADSGSRLVTGVLQMAQGIGATSTSAPKIPVPVDDTTWQSWLAWMGGEVRFGESHKNALLMYQARTGEDPLATLAEAWPIADDSASLVLGAILQAMDRAAPPGPEQLAEEIASESAPRIEAAQRALSRTDPGLHEPTGEALARTLLAPLVDSIVAGGRAPWPGIESTTESGYHPTATKFHGVSEVPVFILQKGHRTLVTLPTGVEPMDSSTWSARDPKEGGAWVEVDPAMSYGPFVLLRWEWTVYQRRAPNESPAGYAGGGTLWLLEIDGAWTVVGVGGWIT